jgi:hypothetical protein
MHTVLTGDPVHNRDPGRGGADRNEYIRRCAVDSRPTGVPATAAAIIAPLL